MHHIYHYFKLITAYFSISLKCNFYNYSEQINVIFGQYGKVELFEMKLSEPIGKIIVKLFWGILVKIINYLYLIHLNLILIKQGIHLFTAVMDMKF